MKQVLIIIVVMERGKYVGYTDHKLIVEFGTTSLVSMGVREGGRVLLLYNYIKR